MSILTKEIVIKLKRLDNYSKHGKWTCKVLQLIDKYPNVRALELSVKLDKPKDWLKLNIRKLKNLGLTISHSVGYSISPRGKKVLNHLTEN